METQLLKEIIACLPRDRTVFRYARDDYALTLLSYVVGNGKHISVIKRSDFGGLLEKPVVKNIIANIGDGQMSYKDCYSLNMKDRQSFVLTVSSWDRDRKYFSQTTSESGNLVLQLNFNIGHDRLFHHLIGNEQLKYFKYYEHPILRRGERAQYRNTLGWARLDLDFNTGEMLIEEIQNDWLRKAKRYQRMMTRYMQQNPDYRNKLGLRSTPETINYYVVRTLGPVYRIWDEAMLTAVIRFCVEELGIGYIYYHTFDTGNRLKQITRGHPPRSLYTELPKKFCFRETTQAPEFLYKSKIVKRKLNRVRNSRWFCLQLPTQASLRTVQ